MHPRAPYFWLMGGLDRSYIVILQEEGCLHDFPMRRHASLMWRSSAFTDPGRKRALNEDAFLNDPDHGVWAVADGMGGHQAGELASRTVIERLEHFEGVDSLPDMVDDLETLLMQANDDLIAEVSKSRASSDVIGTTVAVLAVYRDFGFILWAGDSRIYRFRNGKLEQLTEDHSMVQELVNAGHLKAADAEDHPAANIILRSVGGEQPLHLDMDYVRIASGDRFLICSDGLYREIPEQTLHRILETEDIHDCNQALRAAALAAGGGDNITSILVDFH